MAGFETRALLGSDPGLVSDRFRYTGVSVPPLDEEAVKRIQQQTKQIFSPVVQSVNYPALFEVQALNQRPFLGSLGTNELNLSGSNPFLPAWKVAEKEWNERINAGLGSGTAFDRLIDARERAGEWDAMQQGVISPGRIGAPRPPEITRNPFSITPLNNPAQGVGFQNTESLKAFEQAMNAQYLQAKQRVLLNPEQGFLPIKAAQGALPGRYKARWYKDPALFQGLFKGLPQATSKAIKQTGSLVADALLPGRHNVPERLAAVIESPGFSDAAVERALFNALPTESIAPDEISTKESRWLLDPRRTPVVGEGMFGSVVVPTNLGSAFKIQSGKTKDFYQNEVDMALRTAELGYGPKVEALTLRSIGDEGDDIYDTYRAITRSEAVPHRKFEQLSTPEQKFLNVERFKVTEGLIRGGILNKDNHTGNILLNDVTKKPVQVDSGLAREYDPFNIIHLNDRLGNIAYGLKAAGLNEAADATRQVGRGLLDELGRNPSPELYAEAENFFNRSGNILLKAPNKYPGQPKQTPRLAGRLQAGIQSATGAVKPATKALLLDAAINYGLGASPKEAFVTALSDPISAENLGGAPTAAIERLGPQGQFVDTRTNTVLSPQGLYTDTGIAYRKGKPVIVPRGSVAGEGNILTQSQQLLQNAAAVWKKRLGSLGIFGR